MKKLAALVISIGALVVVPVVATAGSPAANHASYGWVVGFLPPGSWDTAKAPDGSWIMMQGHGTLQTGPDRSVTSTWVATAADSFVSWGSSTFMRLRVSGGEAKLRVTLSDGESGVLTIFCDAPGSHPPEGKEVAEGINLILGSGVSSEYTEQAGGNTVFLGPM